MAGRGRSGSRGRGNASRKSPDREATLAIESLAAGGDGVGHLPDGRVAFVPAAAPGDGVRVRYRETRRRYVRAELVEVVEAGSARVEPACEVFGRCGGCTWQHVDYPAQLDAKRQILREQLRRIGGITDLPEIEMFPSPSPFGYRSRTRLLIESGKVGFRRGLSHEIEPIDHCPILAPKLDRALAELSRDLASGGPSATQLDGLEWELALGDGGEVRSCALSASAPRGSGRASKLMIRAGGEQISVSAGGFTQSNSLLRDRLHREVLRAATRGGGGLLLELFAGAGFFSLGLARRFDQLICVESGSRAVADLRANLVTAGIDNVEVRPGRVEDVLANPGPWRPDVVLLDPPRAGLVGEACARLVEIGARGIVYLSCDPATLARDLATLVPAGYRLREIAGFDLFPQTPHIEALVSLDRED